MQASCQKQYKLSELLIGLDAKIVGEDCLIHGVSTIQDATSGQIAFLNNPQYKKYLTKTQASAVIVSEEHLNDCNATAVITRNPYFVYAKVANYFNKYVADYSGIHDTVVIAYGCDIHPSVAILANTVIGKNVKLHENVIIGPNCYIGDDVTIDAGTRIDANVAIYHGVVIGKRTNISSGVVIGSDGFGFANQAGIWHKVPQLGSVKIGNDVDIGANTTIDRGAILDTEIDDGVKLDNQIQIGHNVKIGANSIIAGCCAIAGSTIIGKNCMIGGSSNFAGHLTIADQVMITGGTDVTKSITEKGIYSSGIVGAVPNLEFRKNNARFHRLENLMERVKNLENALTMILERQEK